MLPTDVLIALPIPFLLALLLIATYHLLPLLHLLSSPAPILSRLASLVPRPRRQRNLPREFFNLPPRPGSPNPSIASEAGNEVGVVLGVKGKVMLMLCAQAGVSLLAGWVYLLFGSTGRGTGALLALSATTLPFSIATMALFAAMRRPSHIARHELSLFRSAVFGSGGVTHGTVLHRVLPYSAGSTIVTSIIAAVLSSPGAFLLAMAMACMVLAICSSWSVATRQHRMRAGMIRISSPSPSLALESPVSSIREKHIALTETDLRMFKDGESFVSSPSRPPTPHSDFSYSPSAASIHSNTSTTPRITTTKSQYDTPKSYLTEETNTPSTIPSWDFSSSPSPSLRSPSTACTRPRSPSAGLPDPVSPRTVTKGSTTTCGDRTMYTHTLNSTPGSALRSAGGSILAGYSPDPFHPMPRGYESLTSFPISPSQSASRATLPASEPSSTSFIFVPAQHASSSGARESTWTLETYRSDVAYQTPKSQIRDQSRRAPPPPPMPVDMPLPPTPSLTGRDTARSDTPFGSEEFTGKGSTELLMGGTERDREREREWDFVDVENGEEGLESWVPGGRGVGALAVSGLAVCTGLAAPLLIIHLTLVTQTLYLLSVLLPVPLLLLTTYHLRPRPITLPLQTRNVKKGSKTSVSTHRSLALVSESQLSLPISISPKLTPPERKVPSVPARGKWDRLLEPKPSISSFGYHPPAKSRGYRRHTVYETPGRQARDQRLEQDMRRNMHRRSTDLWLEMGHAKPAGNVLERAAEMMKPDPALRIMDADRTPGQSALTRLRGGVVSMLPKRFSQLARDGGIVLNDIPSTPSRRRVSAFADAYDENDDVPSSPITISITSPSKFERQRSRLSRADSIDESRAKGEIEGAGEEDGEGEGEEMAGEIQTATRARMSASPTIFLGRTGAGSPDEDGYELDWLQAGILPQLLPHIKIGAEVVVQRFPSGRGPVHGQFADAESPRPSRTRQPSQRRNSLAATTVLVAQEVDFGPPQPTDLASVTGSRRELRHKHSFSLPLIDKASFSDLRSQMRQVGIERRHHWSIYADAPGDNGEIDFSDPLLHPAVARVVEEGDYPSDTGIDLPAFPSDFSHPHHASADVVEAGGDLSIIEEGNESLVSQTTASLARLTFSAEALMRTPSTHQHQHQASESSFMVGQESFVSEYEAMAREMETVLAMDESARAEFVASPTPSEATTASARTSWSRFSASAYGSARPLSRSASAASVLEGGRLDKKVSTDTFGSAISASSTAYTSSPSTGSVRDEHTFGTDSVPPLPPLPALLRRPASQNFAFAHPFPASTSTSSTSAHPFPTHSAFVFPPPPAAGADASKKRPISVTLDRPIPISAHPSVQTLVGPSSHMGRKSVDTLHSEVSEYSPKRWPTFKPSMDELRRVEELQARAAGAGASAGANALAPTSNTSSPDATSSSPTGPAASETASEWTSGAIDFSKPASGGWSEESFTRAATHARSASEEERLEKEEEDILDRWAGETSGVIASPVIGGRTENEEATADGPETDSGADATTLSARLNAVRTAEEEAKLNPKLGRVEKEVKVIELRAKNSLPPSPEKHAVVTQRRGLRPLKLLANRPPSVIGTAGGAAVAAKIDVVRTSFDSAEGEARSLPTRTGFGKISASPKKSNPPVISSVPSVTARSTPSRKKMSNKSVDSARKENLPVVPSLTGGGGATPGRRGKMSNGSAGGSTRPGVSGIRA